MLCYISHNYRHVDSAGNKAKSDMETLMAERGMRNIGLPATHFPNKCVAFVVNLAGIVKALSRLRRGDILFLQYPLKKYYALVCRVAAMKGAYTVTLVHDLGSCRRRKLSVAKEIKRLSHTHCIIALNDAMRAWLKRNGSNVPSISLGIWDYLSPAEAPAREWIPGEVPEIVYAGGLAHRKNEFLYRVGLHLSGFRILLYGRGFEETLCEDGGMIVYKGFASPASLIESGQGRFGLVWDGHSLEECAGDFGSYLRLNNPHKVSLYLRCALPVLIWRKAALAPYIEKHEAGVLIDSLYDIPKVIASMTPERYERLQEGVRRLSRAIAAGEHYNAAVDRALDIIRGK